MCVGLWVTDLFFTIPQGPQWWTQMAADGAEIRLVRRRPIDRLTARAGSSSLTMLSSDGDPPLFASHSFPLRAASLLSVVTCLCHRVVYRL